MGLEMPKSLKGGNCEAAGGEGAGDPAGWPGPRSPRCRSRRQPFALLFRQTDRNETVNCGCRDCSARERAVQRGKHLPPTQLSFVTRTAAEEKSRAGRLLCLLGAEPALWRPKDAPPRARRLPFFFSSFFLAGAS